MPEEHELDAEAVTAQRRDQAIGFGAAPQRVDVAGRVDPVVEPEAAVVRPPPEQVEAGGGERRQVGLEARPAGRRPLPAVEAEAGQRIVGIDGDRAVLEADRVVRLAVRERPAIRIRRVSPDEAGRRTGDDAKAPRNGRRHASRPRRGPSTARCRRNRVRSGTSTCRRPSKTLRSPPCDRPARSASRVRRPPPTGSPPGS